MIAAKVFSLAAVPFHSAGAAAEEIEDVVRALHFVFLKL